MKRPRMKEIVTIVVVGCVESACGQSSRADRPPSDPAIVAEQKRRIAAFDSVVRTVNTDSAYRIWRAMLTSKQVRADQLAMQCEYDRLGYRYGRAANAAIKRMEDTLWTGADPRAVARLDASLAGASPETGRDTCKPYPAQRAPKWLEEWTIYELPKLPPSPDSAEATGAP